MLKVAAIGEEQPAGQFMPRFASIELQLHPLLERNHHRVVLTDSGQTFLTGARQTLQCAVRTIETTRQTARDKAAQLRIANIGLMCPSVLINLIRAFRERFPKVQISVVQHNSREWPGETLEQAQLAIGNLEGSKAR